jgi:hypothetical protein
MPFALRRMNGLLRLTAAGAGPISPHMNGAFVTIAVATRRCRRRIAAARFRA